MLLRPPAVLLMRMLSWLLRIRRTCRLRNWGIRALFDGFEGFFLDDLFQSRRQIHFFELLLPTRAPLFESSAQFLLERFRNRGERLKGFGPLDHRDSCRRVGANRTFDRAER